MKTLAGLHLKVFPFVRWFRGYGTSHFRADFVSGLTVALVLIPQSMAYAQLADLPAYYGLYAAFLPPIVAALWGSSNQLATGPVAIVSLMTSTALAPLATAGSADFVAYAILLAVVVGLFQFLLGVLRLGMVVNFLSHPVVNGFTNAAAIIIATSQLSKLFGVNVDKAEHHYETVYHVVEAAIQHTHLPTLGLGALAFAIMIVLRRTNPRIPNVLIAVVVTTVISWAIGFEKNVTIGMEQIHSEQVHELIAEYNRTLDAVNSQMQGRVDLNKQIRSAQTEHGSNSIEVIQLQSMTAMADVLIKRLKERASELRGELRAYNFISVDETDSRYTPARELTKDQFRGKHNWDLRVGNRELNPDQLTLAGGGAVVGIIPPGLPELTIPRVDFSVMFSLLPMAIIISLLGFMEAISIAKAMAARTGQRLDPNQELIGQGLANIVGAIGQSYPVSGSFSRSAVNLQAGAVTGLSSAISSFVVLITLIFFTPLLYHLPQSVLAAIIMVAVIGLVNVSGFIHAWKAQWFDGFISIITFVLTLLYAPHLDRGIMIGVLLSLILYLLRNMKPQIALLSKTPDGHYRNADRWHLEKCDHVAVVRFNNSLIFANVNYLEDTIYEIVEEMEGLRHIIVAGAGMNELDASGEVLLSKLITSLRQKGLDISFSGLNDHVLDVMKRTHLYEKAGADHFYLSVNQAVNSILKGRCIVSGGLLCPLVVSRGLALEVEEESVKGMIQHHPWIKQSDDGDNPMTAHGKRMKKES
jgi:sulfate permease, SulP family